VHCAAGIAHRTVIGCLLVENGRRGRRLCRSSTACGSKASGRAMAARSETPSRPSTCGAGSRTQRARSAVRARHSFGARALRSAFTARSSGWRWGIGRGRHPVPPAGKIHARWADMLGGGPLTCPAAAGATTPRWRCASPRACSGARASIAAIRSRATAAGSREGYLFVHGHVSESPFGTARALGSRNGGGSRFPVPRPRDARPEALSRVAPVVMYFFAQPGAGGAVGRRGGPHHLARRRRS